jgi:polyhydroxyalkanoate synthesis regulator protein
MSRITVSELSKRVDAIEESINKQNELLQQMMSMLAGNSNQPKTTKGKSTTTTKVDREAKREAEKADFKANHKLVRTSKQNKELVYAEMKKQGITEFNRKDYERIAKGLGVLGASGKVVSTWEAIK